MGGPGFSPKGVGTPGTPGGGLPMGTEQGQLIQWDAVSGTWIIVPAAALADGVSLVFDTVTGLWVPTAPGAVGGGLPAGAVVNTELVWDDTAEEWVTIVHESEFVTQAADITNNTAGFVDMGSMSCTVAVPGSANVPCGVRAWFNASVSTSGGNGVTLVKFRIMLDGVAQMPAFSCSPPVGDNGSEGCGAVWQSGVLAAGNHTVKVQWKNFNAVNSISHCRPVAANESEGAGLLVETRLIR